MNQAQLELLRGKLSGRPCLLGREDYLNAAVLMLLIPLNGEYHFVLEERRPEIRRVGKSVFPVERSIRNWMRTPDRLPPGKQEKSWGLPGNGYR